MIGVDKEQWLFHQKADHARHENRLANPFLKRRERRLAALVRENAPARVGRLLDLGCGEGSFLGYLAPLFPNTSLVGLDFSRQKLTCLRSMPQDACAVCADAVAPPFAPGSFDLIVCRDLLHHLPHAQAQVIEAAMALLAPGGRMVIFENRGANPLNLLFRLLVPAERGMRLSTPDHFLSMTKRFGDVRLSFPECSLLPRALGYLLGWPEHPMLRLLVSPPYMLAEGWDALWGALPGRRHHAMMAFTVEKS